MVTISRCQTKRDLKTFERIPEILHKSNPCFVPPYPGSISKLFNRKSPFFRHGDMFPFIAWENGKPVGRIVATVYRSHNEYYRDKVGFFGFFDFVNRKDVASALLEKARETLAQQGLETMRGPYNPTVNDEIGLLVEGFDLQPMVMMPYNPPYYMDIYETLGLVPVRNFCSYYMAASKGVPERMKKIADRAAKRTKLVVRNLNLKKLRDELKIIQSLYNVTLDRNWGFVPITLEDLEFAAEDLKAIMDPKMAMIAELDGEPVAFNLCLPNVNEFMANAKHLPEWLRVLKFIWQLKTKTPKDVRVAILGVHPKYRVGGIGPLFYYISVMRSQQYYTGGGEMGWMEENNKEIISSMKALGAHKVKGYRVFEKTIENSGAVQ